MPGGDGTGPLGTYRNCMPIEHSSQVSGFGYGAGFGRGRGRGNGYDRMSMHNPRGLLRPRFYRFGRGQLSKEEELSILKENKKGLETRIQELEK